MRTVKERLNLYITKSLMDDLRRRKLREAIKKSYGAWKDEDHPELKTGKDIDRWIEKGRKSLTRDFSAEWGPDE